MADEIETASIWSGSGSVDGMCDSETEQDQFHTMNLPLEHAGDTRTNMRPVDFPDDEDSPQVPQNEKWTKHKKPKVNTPFTRNFGPNILGEIKSPSQIFLYLFTQDLLDLIVDETNRYLKQNKQKLAKFTECGTWSKRLEIPFPESLFYILLDPYIRSMYWSRFI